MLPTLPASLPVLTHKQTIKLPRLLSNDSKPLMQRQWLRPPQPSNFQLRLM